MLYKKKKLKKFPHLWCKNCRAGKIREKKRFLEIEKGKWREKR